VQTETEAHAVNQPPHSHFRRRVPAPYPAHVRGAARWGDRIHGWRFDRADDRATSNCHHWLAIEPSAPLGSGPWLD
jgi:hypothetical protein